MNIGELSKPSVVQKHILGVTAIEFGEGGKITRIETNGDVNVHDLFQMVRDWNSQKWVHPKAVETEANFSKIALD